MSGRVYAEIDTAFGQADTTGLAASLSDDRREELRRFWLGRASGELTTALSFEYMLADLQALGAPGALTGLAEHAIAEEHRHVDYCLRFARLLGDEPAQADLGGTRPLVFEGAGDAENRLLRTIFGSCFSETVAVQVLLASQREITLESVRRLNQQHVTEEVRHARLGWGLLAWSGLSDRDRSMLAAFVPAMSALTRALWLAPQRPSDSKLEGLGYLSRPLVERALQQAFDEVILPGLERNGIRGSEL
ncbi:MAG TPA: diiron oxygenase [Polyangiaceae bacterium]|nr:diiron oxygenase [Polyangiaceae bacterium]